MTTILYICLAISIVAGIVCLWGCTTLLRHSYDEWKWQKSWEEIVKLMDEREKQGETDG